MQEKEELMLTDKEQEVIKSANDALILLKIPLLTDNEIEELVKRLREVDNLEG